MSAHADPTADPAPKDPYAKTSWIRELWNSIVTDPIPKCRGWSKKLHDLALPFIRDHDRESFRMAFEAVNQSDHHRGDNERGWVLPGISWMLQGSRTEDRIQRFADLYQPPPEPVPPRQSTPEEDAAWEKHRIAFGLAEGPLPKNPLVQIGIPDDFDPDTYDPDPTGYMESFNE